MLQLFESNKNQKKKKNLSGPFCCITKSGQIGTIPELVSRATNGPRTSSWAPLKGLNEGK